MTGDLEHPTIYTYGRSSALYSESLGNKSFTGEGVLTILSMKDATDYLADRNASGISYIIFEYKGSDKNIDAYYQSLFENGVSATYGVSKGKENARVISRYNFFFNNCVIVSLLGMNKGGIDLTTDRGTAFLSPVELWGILLESRYIQKYEGKEAIEFINHLISQLPIS